MSKDNNKRGFFGFGRKKEKDTITVNTSSIEDRLDEQSDENMKTGGSQYTNLLNKVNTNRDKNANSTFSYLFDKNSQTPDLSSRFETVKEDRERRVNKTLRHEGISKDVDVFALTKHKNTGFGSEKRTEKIKSEFAEAVADNEIDLEQVLHDDVQDKRKELKKALEDVAARNTKEMLRQTLSDIDLSGIPEDQRVSSFIYPDKVKENLEANDKKALDENGNAIANNANFASTKEFNTVNDSKNASSSVLTSNMQASSAPASVNSVNSALTSIDNSVKEAKNGATNMHAEAGENVIKDTGAVKTVNTSSEDAINYAYKDSQGVKNITEQIELEKIRKAQQIEAAKAIETNKLEVENLIEQALSELNTTSDTSVFERVSMVAKEIPSTAELEAQKVLESSANSDTNRLSQTQIANAASVGNAEAKASENAETPVDNSATKPYDKFKVEPKPATPISLRPNVKFVGKGTYRFLELPVYIINIDSINDIVEDEIKNFILPPTENERQSTSKSDEINATVGGETKEDFFDDDSENLKVAHPKDTAKFAKNITSNIAKSVEEAKIENKEKAKTNTQGFRVPTSSIPIIDEKTIANAAVGAASAVSAAVTSEKNSVRSTKEFSIPATKSSENEKSKEKIAESAKSANKEENKEKYQSARERRASKESFAKDKNFQRYAKSIKDFESLDEKAFTEEHLKQERNKSFLFALITIICTLCSFASFITFEFFLFPSQSALLYLFISFVLLAIPVGINIIDIINGIKRLFVLQANGVTALSFALIAVLIQHFALFFNQDSLQGKNLYLYTPVILSALALHCLSNFIKSSRTIKNFKVLSRDSKFYAVKNVESEDLCTNLAHNALSSQPSIAFCKKTLFIKNFLQNSKKSDKSEDASLFLVPILLILSAILTVLVAFLIKDLSAALSTLALALIMSTPFTSSISINLPLSRFCQKARIKECVVANYDAVDSFSSTNAALIDAADLFPKNSMSISRIENLRKDEQISKATLYVAALLMKSNCSTLKQTFLNHLHQTAQEKTPPCDNCTTVKGKGFYGTCNNIPLLFGTRKFLEERNIDVPAGIESDYVNHKNRAFFFAQNGKMVAMYIITYDTDKETEESMVACLQSGIKVILKTSDPAININFLSERFKIDEQAIAIVHESIEEQVEQELFALSENEDFTAVTKGKLSSLLSMLVLAVKFKPSIGIIVFLQYFCVVLGFILISFFALSGAFTQLSTTAILAYEAFFAIVILLIPKFFRT